MTTYLGDKPVGIGTIKATKAVAGDVLHDSTLTGNGYTEPLGVDTNIIATTEYVHNKDVVLQSGIRGNADAIQKTRDDMNEEDGRLQTQITAHAEAITALQNEQTATGNQIQTIESKIPGGTSGTNSLVNKQILADYVMDTEMDIREDMNRTDSELQTQITSQAAAINQKANKSDIPDVSGLATKVEVAGKQDKLTAGANITIVDNVISSTGGGGGTAEYPDQTGNAGKFLVTDGTDVSWSNTVSGPLSIDGGTFPYSNSSLPVLNILAKSSYDNLVSYEIVLSSGGSLNFDRLSIENVSMLTPAGNGRAALGTTTNKWALVCTDRLWNGGFLSLPTTGGTLARIEDIDAAVGDISTALTAILGE